MGEIHKVYLVNSYFHQVFTECSLKVHRSVVLFMVMKRLDLMILTLCFLPSYFWYVKRMISGGEEAVPALLIPVCLFAAWKIKPVFRFDAFTIAGAGLYLTLWLVAAPAMIKAGVAILTLLHYTGFLRSFGVSALAFLSLPWVSSFQYFFGHILRKIVAEGASLTLNVVGVPVHAEGTGLAFRGSQVFVDPPCSGVKMIWAILFLSAMLCVLFSSSWGKGIVTCFCALLLAIMGNIIRATILFFPESQLVEWPYWTHDAIGVIAYVSVCGVLIFSHRFMNYEPKKTITHYVNP